MKAGRELDALVAERVMGWHKGSCGECNNRPWLPSEIQCQYWHNQNNEDTKKPIFDIWSGGMGERLEKRAWSPSTDIAAAWEVAEKLKLAVIPGDDGKWRATDSIFVVDCIWYETKLEGEATADTVPHAICLAALKVMGVEV